MYKIEEPIEDKIKRAQSKVDTGLIRTGSNSPQKSPTYIRPRTALDTKGFKNRKWSNGMERNIESRIEKEPLHIQKYMNSSMSSKLLRPAKHSQSPVSRIDIQT